MPRKLFVEEKFPQLNLLSLPTRAFFALWVELREFEGTEAHNKKEIGINAKRIVEFRFLENGSKNSIFNF
ncbi:TPA: hypothetical protein SHZ35_002777 [Staphylococcus aureus]|nr:hypothetical protein [Staphylococcus aureus]HEH8089203.1 hypothetical protein [Staphylococcus aureus]